MSIKTQPQNSSRVFVYQSAPAQNIPNNLVTTVRLDTAVFDSLNEFDLATYEFTPINAGYYLICGQVRHQVTNIAGHKRLDLLETGAVGWITQDYKQITVLGIETLYVTGIAYLTPNSVVRLQMYQTSLVAMPLSVAGDLYAVHLQIHRLS